MNQPALFSDNLWQALTDCVRAMGGAKVVGAKLRPEIDPQDAGRWLLDCLNPTRKDKLCGEQILWVLREARKANCHVGMAFVCADTGYAPPQPIEPEDEKAALKRAFIQSVETQRQIMDRLERLS